MRATARCLGNGHPLDCRASSRLIINVDAPLGVQTFPFHSLATEVLCPVGDTTQVPGRVPHDPTHTLHLTRGKPGLRAGKGWAGTHTCTLGVLSHLTYEGVRPRETRRLSQSHAAKPFHTEESRHICCPGRDAGSSLPGRDPPPPHEVGLRVEEKGRRKQKIIMGVEGESGEQAGAW